jgi:uncharacterized protein (DUF488 family)
LHQPCISATPHLTSPKQVKPLWTIGHSTRSLEEVIALLQENGIEMLADVRRYPASRRHPQFDRANLERTLPDAGVAYCWMPELGGRRAPRKDSRNTAWRVAGFRGYADHMETEGWQFGLMHLLEQADDKPTAIMCAEHAWQQCHRGLISDFVKAQGRDVIHILRPGRTELHPWTAAARIVDGRLSYAAEEKPSQKGLEF